MRKLLALTLILGLSVAVGGMAGASGGTDTDPWHSAIGVKYEWSGNDGELSLLGAPGSRYAVYDSAGNVVAAGLLGAPYESFTAGNSGVGPDGVIVYVLVDGDVTAIVDPDWEWN